MNRFMILATAGLLLNACAGKLDYTPPYGGTSTTNTKTVAKSKDEVWKELIPELSKQFFVINNVDKSSGLLNVSYSGDPERYVDCGTVSSYVKNARGERSYVFPGARASQTYEAMTDNLYFINRTMSLDGRMNVIVQETGPSSSSITVNTRYVVTRTVRVQGAAGGAGSFTDTINFNTGQLTSFPASGNLPATQCRPTGMFEAEVLGLVN
ncbi:MAG TPA: hypothetical protein VF194_07275 [Ferrovibrio sp.]|uniref:hypothetical protein n=1 Tax=Ferrovibrio sp. TaxID=1917215 RepID=UPI002ED0A399